MSKQKPLILYCCTPMTGHLMPNLQIAADLVRRGYDVTFLGAPTCRDKIEAAGCRYATHIGLAAYCVEGMSQFVQAYPEMLTMNRNDLEPAEILNRIVEMTTVNLVPSQLESARIAAAAMHAREPEREIILVCDSWWWGIIPLKLGQSLLAPFVKENDQELQTPVKSLGISVIPAMFSSIDSGPGFGALGYDSSPEGRERNRAAAEKFNTQRSRETGQLFIDTLKRTLRDCGVVDRSAIDKLLAAAHPEGFPSYAWEAPYVAHNTTLQMCIPQLEWPISDRPASVRFGGTLPTRAIPANIELPEWMEELRANGRPGEKAERKKVIVVAQGTVDYDHRNLVIPTIEAFAGDESVLVVAILCFRGASLAAFYQNAGDATNTAEWKNGLRYLDHVNAPANGDGGEKPPLPSNARVASYLPFDVILPYADVFVSRTGYGGLQHAISNGVPMVQGGETLDKPEIGLRVEFAGLGVRLRGYEPAKPETVKDLATKVLEDGKFRARAQELKAEAEKFGALDTVERELRALWDN